MGVEIANMLNKTIRKHFAILATKKDKINKSGSTIFYGLSIIVFMLIMG